jgi:cell division protein FtsQ
MRVLVVLALVAGVVWLFRSPLLAVQNIEIVGASQVDARGVLSDQGIDRGVAMMDVDLDVAVTILEDDPWVKAAEAHREWPQTVTVEVEERVPVAWVSAADAWHHVAIDGVSLGEATQPGVEQSAIIFPAEDSSGFSTDRNLLGLLEFVTTLPPEYQAVTSVAAAGDALAGSEFMANVAGYQVRLGSGEEGREKALALVAVLETEPEPGSIITVIAPAQPAVLPPEAAAETQTSTSTAENPEEG